MGISSGSLLVILRGVPLPSPSQSRSCMAWYRHPSVKTKLILLDHLIDVLIIVVGAWVVTWVLHRLFPHSDWLKVALEIVDGIGSVTVLIRFFINMLIKLSKEKGD